MRKKIKINSKVTIAIFVFIILILITTYTNIIVKNINKREFENKMIEISEKNKEPIFSVKKIYLCSSANVIDNSIEKNLQDLNIYQYADIAIYINNKNKVEELTKQNTIKELYIDNISLESNSAIGQRSLSYTNSLNFGNGTDVKQSINTDRIDFDIIYTNDENNKADYSKPTFYTDCSNPITLKYLNKDIVKGYKMNEDKTLSFDGRLLKEANISKKDIQCKIKFKINLVNNNDERFSCWIDFDIPLNELYTKGKTIKSANTTGSKYEFFSM